MDYSAFSTADFLCDEYFQNWIIRPDKDTVEFWNSWLLQHPEKAAAVDAAKKILLNIKFKEHIPEEEQASQSLAATLSILHALKEPPDKAKIISIAGLRKMIKIAAIFILIASAGGIIYYSYWNEKTTISTRYGEIRKVMLPDGSTVTLNAHSAISYFKHERNSLPRQIWLEGEAFFNVKHINKNENDIKESERFIVSTNDLNVNVLGTSFNVKKRGPGTEVMLKSGKIAIEFTNGSQPSVTMVPGQMIVYNYQSRPLLKSVEPEIYTTWINKRLILRESSIKEIAQYIQDYFGYKVILEDTVIGNKKMEGTLLMDDMQDVLFVLSSTLNIKIDKKENTLIFKNRR
jgi:ferric-dicitrate binding protein FerR (iron transport regulator)